MQGSISDFGVGVLAVTDNDGNHKLDFLWVIDILTDLTECHDASMLVAPIISLEIDCINDQFSDQWEHN